MDDYRRRSWNNRCPNCREDFAIRQQWDYEDEFQAECPHCKCKLHVVVEHIPEFGMMRKADYDELEKQRISRITMKHES